MLSFKKKNIKSDLNLTPMIDMVFLLLIFFLLTANFLREEGMSIKLPTSKSSTLKEFPTQITVFINAKGEIFVDKIPTDMSKLYQIFCKKVQHLGKEVIVVVKADKLTPVEWVVKVMDRASLAGIKKLFIATERES